VDTCVILCVLHPSTTLHSACALTQQHFFFRQNQYKHMMSACSSDLNVSGENSVARGSCSESEPVGKEDFSPAGFKTDGAETLKREDSVLPGRYAALSDSLLPTFRSELSAPTSRRQESRRRIPGLLYTGWGGTNRLPRNVGN
jgi:hypothetical protein